MRIERITLRLFLGAGVLAFLPALVFPQGAPGGVQPELVLPVLTGDSTLHISGSLTCDRSRDCVEGTTPLIEIRGQLRLMEEEGIRFVDVAFKTEICPSDGSRRRLAFSTKLPLNGYIEQDNIVGASLFLDAVSAEKGGRQPPVSLGWFTAAAQCVNNLAPYVVNLGNPQRDGVR